MSLLYAVHQQYKLLLYTCTRSEVGRLYMSPQQGQLLKGLPHCTQRRELGLELESSDVQLDMHVVVWTCDFFACSVSGGVFVWDMHTHSHTHQCCNGCLFSL